MRKKLKKIIQNWHIVRAIKQNKLNFAIQYIRDVENWVDGMEDKKCEVLARLNIRNKNITPDIFIPIAKEKNCYHIITKTIIKKSFKYMNEHPEIEEFSINLNMFDIRTSETIDFLIMNIENYNIGDRLVIELTEDEELTNELKKTKAVIKRLKDLNCKIALDDFGKGYATFDPLINLDLDYIKLDKVLTGNFLANEHKFYIISLLSEYSKRLEISLVVEWIEKQEEYEAIKYMDIEYAQGYHLHEPYLIVS